MPASWPSRVDLPGKTESVELFAIPSKRTSHRGFPRGCFVWQGQPGLLGTDQERATRRIHVFFTWQELQPEQLIMEWGGISLESSGGFWWVRVSICTSVAQRTSVTDDSHTLYILLLTPISLSLLDFTMGVSEMAVSREREKETWLSREGKRTHLICFFPLPFASGWPSATTW